MSLDYQLTGFDKCLTTKSRVY